MKTFTWVIPKTSEESESPRKRLSWPLTQQEVTVALAVVDLMLIANIVAIELGKWFPQQ